MSLRRRHGRGGTAGGLSDLLTVLDAHRQQLAIERDLAASNAAVLCATLPAVRRPSSTLGTLPSVVSGCSPCEAAHTGTDGGMALKASDFTCIRLTWEEHREYHAIGKVAFERKHGMSCADVVWELNRAWAVPKQRAV
jgi:hypothetical protein